MNNVSSNSSKQSDVTKGIVARGVQVIGVFIFQGLLLFPIAGKLDWIWAWIFLGIYLISIIINSIFLFINDPEMIAERGKPKEFKKWDILVSSIWGVTQFLLIPIIASIDYRIGWTQNLGIFWHIIGVISFSLGLALFGWAMITNAYFSTAVRIQDDRGQKVCKTGPYKIVRHPGYLGTIFQSIGIPILLGSIWALIPGVIAIISMLVRTYFEDNTLNQELSGYIEYSQEVKFRIFPAIW
jgi:protein-S-isoprenylcysteine O-methyltransferase Ste14